MVPNEGILLAKSNTQMKGREIYLENWNIDKKCEYFKVSCLSFNKIGQVILLCPTSAPFFQCPLWGFSYNLQLGPRNPVTDLWYPALPVANNLCPGDTDPLQQYITKCIFCVLQFSPDPFPLLQMPALHLANLTTTFKELIFSFLFISVTAFDVIFFFPTFPFL